ncbi:MAG: DUF4296 domain-containing protein [Chitinophagales bacterium]|nr:DUF4296 domain-containing protein [Chitinophagales bacterium]
MLIAFASCTHSDVRPRNLLPEAKMVEVMVDVHIFEAMAEGKKWSEDSLAVLLDANYGEIFKKHGIQQEQFERTFAYYESNPGKMDEMMTKVIEELSKIEAGNP